MQGSRLVMPRAFIIMLDSFGVGAADDADKYGDISADTLRHIAQACAQGRADRPGVRSGPLNIPNLVRLGINGAAKASQGSFISELPHDQPIHAMYGCAAEKSLGKDTQSGHWELAGVPVLFEWGYFPPAYPSFPETLLNDLMAQTNIPGVLGNKHASGTEIIADLGAEHQATGKPIVYTSGDSVFQIAAHEESFGLEKLYQLCEVTRKLVDEYNIGRVIARPFLGTAGNYYRTGNRKDYATPPPALTLLDHLKASGKEVIAIGKVADIYAHQGVTKVIKANGNEALFQAFTEAAKTAPDGSITFVNLVDFDMLYGHRRDVIGYAKALEDFDRWLANFETVMKPGDIAVITADHGCDPTYKGTDHTRENVPVLFFGPGIREKSIGKRDSFADIGQTLAQHLALSPLQYGTSVL